jgi:hypothetical protein
VKAERSITMPSYKGRFKPKNPHKYKGDASKIIYRSLWELKVFRKCDEHPDIVEWQSEEVIVPYQHPIKGRIARYYPDLVIKKRIAENQFQTIMIEIKPKKQTSMPNPINKHNTPSGRVSRRYLNESATYAVNRAKWDAAEKYCRERGWVFSIMTEDHIKPLGK